MRFDQGMTSDRFIAYVRHVIAPTLRAGQVVAADNLRAHHAAAARDALEARGATLLHPSAYSPGFIPIKHTFSKVKTALRRASLRTDDDLRAATWDALAYVSPTDAAGWFFHCGYFPIPHPR